MTEKASTTKYWVMGAIAALVLMGGIIAGIIHFATAMVKDSEAYRMGMARLDANTRAVEMLGPPITTGWVQGKFRTTGSEGEASIAIPVTGQKARGMVFVEATMSRGLWKPDLVELHVDGLAQPIDLLQ